MHQLRLLLTLLVSTAHAYHLTFYDGDPSNLCDGEIVHELDIQPSDGCLDGTSINAIACSVRITRTPEDDPGEMVGFFDSATCGTTAKEANALGNAGCLTVGVWNKFQSIGLFTPSTERPGPASSNIQHGDLYEQDGIRYRWRQIAKSAFTGVLEEKWSDEIVAKTEELKFEKNYPVNFTALDGEREEHDGL